MMVSSYHNQVEDPGSSPMSPYIRSQIKSIFNRGTWDSANPDINYSMLEERGAELWANDDKFKKWFSGSRITR